MKQRKCKYCGCSIVFGKDLINPDYKGFWTGVGYTYCDKAPMTDGKYKFHVPSTKEKEILQLLKAVDEINIH